MPWPAGGLGRGPPRSSLMLERAVQRSTSRSTRVLLLCPSSFVAQVADELCQRFGEPPRCLLMTADVEEWSGRPEGNCTPGLAQIRTQTSRFIRLLSSWSPRLPDADAVLLPDPPHQPIVDAGEQRVARRAMETPVVGHPAAEPRIDHPGQVRSKVTSWPLTPRPHDPEVHDRKLPHSHDSRRARARPHQDGSRTTLPREATCGKQRVDGEGTRETPMRYSILGPLDISDGSGPIEINRQFYRTLAATLLLDPNRVVPVTRLIDSIWECRSPLETRPDRQRRRPAVRSRVRQRPGLGGPHDVLHRLLARTDPWLDDALDLGGPAAARSRGGAVRSPCLRDRSRGLQRHRSRRSQSGTTRPIRPSWSP